LRWLIERKIRLFNEAATRRPGSAKEGEQIAVEAPPAGNLPGNHQEHSETEEHGICARRASELEIEIAV
jgi:hypothetical protein